MNTLVVVLRQGLGRRRIEGSLPNTHDLIDWIPLKEELQQERPLISSYQFHFHARDKVPQVLVQHAHQDLQRQPLRRTPSTTYQHTYRSYCVSEPNLQLQRERKEQEGATVPEPIKSAPPTVSEPGPPAVSEPGPPAVSEPGPPAVSEPTVPTVSKPTAPTLTKPTAPTVTKSTAPTLSKPIAPTLSKPTAPTSHGPTPTTDAGTSTEIFVPGPFYRRSMPYKPARMTVSDCLRWHNC